MHRLDCCGEPGPKARLDADLMCHVTLTADGQTHGVMLLNSNGMDVAITDAKLQYRVIGGVLDFYFFMGPTPLKVIDQLTSIIGRPYMPPYWALGLMQSK